jgi:hypothetical protein
MGIFKRALVQDGTGVMAKALAGTGTLGNIAPVEVTADTAQTITVGQMSAGAVFFTGFSAGRNLTTPTAAQINAVADGMDIGDSIQFFVSIQDAFAGTWVAGSGITLRGRATTPASSWSCVVVVKTGAATFDWIVL